MTKKKETHMNERIRSIAKVVGGEAINSGGGVPNVEIKLADGNTLYLAEMGWYVTGPDGERLFTNEDMEI